MSRAVSPAAGRRYGLARVARIWRLSRATVYRRRFRGEAAALPRRRPGPAGPCPDAELVGHIRARILASRLHGEGYRKIRARLRHAGIRTSARRVRRLMGEHGLLAPHRVGRPGRHAHDGTIATAAVDVMWGTDMTETVTLAEGRARVFVAVDHCSGECVGTHAAASGNRSEALEPVRQGGRAAPLRRRRSRRRPRSCAAPRPRLQPHVGRLPGRDPLPRHRGLAVLRPPAGGQRRGRALHPHPRGELLVGARLRDHRGSAPGAAGLRRPPQRHLARRPARPPHPEPGPRRAAKG